MRRFDFQLPVENRAEQLGCGTASLIGSTTTNDPNVSPFDIIDLVGNEAPYSFIERQSHL
jgi:hypothetical protein